MISREDFGERNELARRHEAAVGMLPAHQGFRTDQPAGGKLDLGLEVEHELATIEPLPHLVLKTDAILNLEMHALIVEVVAAVRPLLGAFEREVRVLDQPVGIGVVGRVDRHAHRDIEMDFALLVRIGPNNLVMDFANEGDDVVQILLVGRDDGELVGAEPGDRIGPPHGLLHPLAAFFEKLVGVGVTDHFVDRFESDDVEEREAHDPVVARRVGETFLEPVAEFGAVDEAGQHVVVRHMPDRHLGAAAIGQVDCRGDQSRHRLALPRQRHERQGDIADAPGLGADHLDFDLLGGPDPVGQRRVVEHFAGMGCQKLVQRRRLDRVTRLDLEDRPHRRIGVDEVAVEIDLKDADRAPLGENAELALVLARMGQGEANLVTLGTQAVDEIDVLIAEHHQPLERPVDGDREQSDEDAESERGVAHQHVVFAAGGIEGGGQRRKNTDQRRRRDRPVERGVDQRRRRHAGDDQKNHVAGGWIGYVHGADQAAPRRSADHHRGGKEIGPEERPVFALGLEIAPYAKRAQDDCAGRHGDPAKQRHRVDLAPAAQGRGDDDEQQGRADHADMRVLEKKIDLVAADVRPDILALLFRHLIDGRRLLAGLENFGHSHGAGDLNNATQR